MVDKREGPAWNVDNHGNALTETHVAYFFLPLPEPLAFPDKYMVQGLEPASLAQRIAWARESDGEAPEHVLSASLCFHQTTVRKNAPGDEDRALFGTAIKALGVEPAERPASSDGAEGATELSRTEALTVVEMAVLFTWEADLDMLDVSEDGVSEALTDAFDRGIDLIRNVQRAYFMVRQSAAFHLVSRPTLPFSIPFAVRPLADLTEQPPPPVELSIFLTNMNVGPVGGDDALDDSELDRFDLAMRAQELQLLPARYLEFVREARVAERLDGDRRASLLFTATACEVLLDEVFAHLLWEEALTPQQGALLFDDSPWITGRVRRHFHARLGGDWSLDGNGPISAWSKDVVAVRNRVIHAGHEPTDAEVSDARGASLDLQTFVQHRLLERVAMYPRTAMATLGQSAGRPGDPDDPIGKLLSDPTETEWKPTFTRWRHCMHQLRASLRSTVAVDVSQANIVVVQRRTGHVQWVAHDPSQRLAAIINREDLGGTSEAQLNALDTVLRVRESAGLDEDVSTAVMGAFLLADEPVDWVPEYRLVPLTGVMVNRQDLDPPA